MEVKRYDMIVVGAGPAGLSAAIEAAKHGVKPIVFDENARPGGQLFKQIHKFFGSKEHKAKIRGFKINPWQCTIHPIRTTRLLFTPLLFRALKTSDELGIAAELKGLHAGSKSGSMHRRGFSKHDITAITLVLLICTAAVLLQIYFPTDIKAAMR